MGQVLGPGRADHDAAAPIRALARRSDKSAVRRPEASTNSQLAFGPVHGEHEARDSAAGAEVDRRAGLRRPPPGRRRRSRAWARCADTGPGPRAPWAQARSSWATSAASTVLMRRPSATVDRLRNPQPARASGVRPGSHAGLITTRRRGSSPTDVVSTPSSSAMVSCTTLRSGGFMGSSAFSVPLSSTSLATCSANVASASRRRCRYPATSRCRRAHSGHRPRAGRPPARAPRARGGSHPWARRARRGCCLRPATRCRRRRPRRRRSASSPNARTSSSVKRVASLACSSIVSTAVSFTSFASASLPEPVVPFVSLDRFRAGSTATT